VNSLAAVAHPLLDALRPVAAACGARLVPVSRMRAGDVPLRWEGELIGGFRLPDLNGALDRMIEQVEAEVGRPLAELTREEKQQVVMLLEERGAFTVRRAVEDVADRLGVSRFTVYNYLNRVDG
jgi:DNA-binding CsgD family transcriptional regulator